MTQQSIEKSFCTTSEAADLLGVSVGTVQQWAECGLLNAWKTVGGHRRVMRDSVERLLRHAPGIEAASAEPDGRRNTRKPLRRSGDTLKRRLTVMVASSDAQLLHYYQVQISSWAIRPTVITSDNAFSALLMLGRWVPDLLVADLSFPSIDCLAMYQALAKAPEIALTKVVAVGDGEELSLHNQMPAAIEVLSRTDAMEKLHAIADRLTEEVNAHPSAH